MRQRFIFYAALCGWLIIAPMRAAADDCGSDRHETQFMRNDLVSLKDHMRSVISAVGNAPSPYAKENENWSPPSYVCGDKAGFVPVSVSYSARLTVDAMQREQSQLFQQKLLEAQAKRDFQAMTALSQQIQAQAMQQGMANQNNTPIQLNVRANESASQTIDPDSVLRDGAGFIALKAQQGGASSGQEQITFYFDKVALKDAKTIASLDLGGDLRAPDKLALLNVRIDLSGPAAVVEAMAKQLNAQAVLNELTEKRAEASD